MFKRIAIPGIMKRPVVGYVGPPLVVALILAIAFVAPSKSNTLFKFVSCTNATLTAAPPTLATGGATVVETAGATCVGAYGGSVPTFRFWEFDNVAQRWSMVQDYSTTNTHNWNTTGLPSGLYYLEVDVRSQDDTTSAYQVVKNLTYRIGPASCTAATLTVSGGTDATHGPTGGTFVMTGGSATCPNPQYRFWIRDPGRAWSIVQDYSATNTHTWGPVGTYYLGQYSMEVDVRDASETVAYDVVANLTYTLTGCTGGTLTAAPTTSVHGSVQVILTATSTCPAGSSGAEYRFWIRDPGLSSRWSMVQNFSSQATYTWAAAATSAIGTYALEVDIRNKGSLEVYEAVVSSQYITT